MATEQDQTDQAKSAETPKPWYKRWWAIALGVLIVLGIVAQFADTDDAPAEPEADETAEPESEPEEEAEEEAETVAVPDVVGMNLADARDELSDLDLEVEEYDTEEDRSIFRAGNWEVVEQDPSGGAEVEAESVVNLGVRHQDDGDEEEEPEEEPEETDEAPAEDEAEEPEAADYEIRFDEDAWLGDEVWIEFELQDHFTGGLMASQAQHTAREGLQEAHEQYPDVYRYVVSIPSQDEDSSSWISNAAFEPETLEQLDLDDPTLNVFEHLDAGSAHPELLD